MIPKDPAMLLSLLNMKLRDTYRSLDQLCEDLDVDRRELEDKMAGLDYVYDALKNQFL